MNVIIFNICVPKDKVLKKHTRRKKEHYVGVHSDYQNKIKLVKT